MDNVEPVGAWHWTSVLCLRTLMSVFGEWRLERLDLSGVTMYGWTELARIVGGRGRLGTVVVEISDIVGAREEELRIVWESTDNKWEWEGECAEKTEGAAGFRKLLAAKHK